LLSLRLSQTQTDMAGKRIEMKDVHSPKNGVGFRLKRWGAYAPKYSIQIITLKDIFRTNLLQL